METNLPFAATNYADESRLATLMKCIASIRSPLADMMAAHGLSRPRILGYYGMYSIGIEPQGSGDALVVVDGEPDAETGEVEKLLGGAGHRSRVGVRLSSTFEPETLRRLDMGALWLDEDGSS